ncbi:cellulase family glycosylhydrolase [Actinoplanes sp. NPDC026619]|uniref:glycoside hydrolase family 5 protein n=1 Tax=Actinoplanes sp. NPDC026619 TaxID=3155798 RepID=UPI0033DCC90D
MDKNHFVDKSGTLIRLRGFNLAGAEYACIEGAGIFDTPDGQAPSDRVIAAMREWGQADAVRVPLNEQCWLGLPAAPAAFAGEKYRGAVRDFVRRLNAYGFVAVLDLHRSAPGDGVPKEQEQMPDRDHSLDFWRSVATGIRTGAVMFDLFNEPFPYAETNTGRAWDCWRNGCTLTSVNTGNPYAAAGLNELVAAVRGTGSTTVVLAGGIHWAESMTQWLKYRPDDPAGQLAASAHAYSFNEYCGTTECFDRDFKPILAQVPLFAGEVGPTLKGVSADFDDDCPPGVVRRGGWAGDTLDWLDDHDVSWTAWSWNPWGDCWSLVQDWGGEPTPVWGKELRRRLAAA